VGSGMDVATRRRLQAALDARSRTDHPFVVAPGDLARTPGVTWAEPVLVIRAAIAGWTRDGMIRQPSFDSEAPDVDPATVERQVAVGPGTARDAAAPAGAGTADDTRRRARRAGVPPAPVDPVPAAFVPPTADELAALAALPSRGGTWSFAGRAVNLTNLDRVLAPGRSDAPPITKRDLVAYFARIAPVMLPHLADRAINVVLFPDGLDRPAFWQRDIGRGAPAWVTAWREPDPPDRQPHAYVVADAPATLAWLGNMAAVELHPWTSLVDRPGEPRWALVDIDPGTATTWEETLVLARLYRTAFDHLAVVGAPKVSGKRGIQVFVPLRPGYTFEETRDWVERVSRAVGAAVPDLVSWEWSKDRRDGRARLDFTQNWRNRTLVSVYSPRPAPGLPVSAPISWDELDDPRLRPDRWTIRTILPRVATVGDLFAGALGPGQELPRL
jgi:bifunctional non-homologous end joining protein LigD